MSSGSVGSSTSIIEGLEIPKTQVKYIIARCLYCGKFKQYREVSDNLYFCNTKCNKKHYQKYKNTNDRKHIIGSVAFNKTNNKIFQSLKQKKLIKEIETEKAIKNFWNNVAVKPNE